MLPADAGSLFLFRLMLLADGQFAWRESYVVLGLVKSKKEEFKSRKKWYRSNRADGNVRLHGCLEEIWCLAQLARCVIMAKKETTTRWIRSPSDGFRNMRLMKGSIELARHGKSSIIIKSSGVVKSTISRTRNAVGTRTFSWKLTLCKSDNDAD